MSIAFGTTVYDPALLVLEKRGYEVSLEAPEDHYPTWLARRDGQEFRATNPVELLGVTQVWETRGPDWQRQISEPSPYERVMDGVPLL